MNRQFVLWCTTRTKGIVGTLARSFNGFAVNHLNTKMNFDCFFRLKTKQTKFQRLSLRNLKKKLQRRKKSELKNKYVRAPKLWIHKYSRSSTHLNGFIQICDANLWSNCGYQQQVFLKILSNIYLLNNPHKKKNK